MGHIVVDDGVATGATTLAALCATRLRQLAIPVAPTESLAAMRQEADEVVRLDGQADFGTLSYYYDDGAICFAPSASCRDQIRRCRTWYLIGEVANRRCKARKSTSVWLTEADLVCLNRFREQLDATPDLLLDIESPHHHSAPWG